MAPRLNLEQRLAKYKEEAERIQQLRQKGLLPPLEKKPMPRLFKDIPETAAIVYLMTETILPKRKIAEIIFKNKVPLGTAMNWIRKINSTRNIRNRTIHAACNGTRGLRELGIKKLVERLGGIEKEQTLTESQKLQIMERNYAALTEMLHTYRIRDADIIKSTKELLFERLAFYNPSMAPEKLFFLLAAKGALFDVNLQKAIGIDYRTRHVKNQFSLEQKHEIIAKNLPLIRGLVSQRYRGRNAEDMPSIIIEAAYPALDVYDQAKHKSIYKFLELIAINEIRRQIAWEIEEARGQRRYAAAWSHAIKTLLPKPKYTKGEPWKEE